MNYKNTEFDDIRQSIIDLLKQKDEFKDYNFLASGIATFIDALAYNTQYMIKYANFAVNETYLDSAQLRSSVVSDAKSIGYVPYQYRAAKAKLHLEVNEPSVIITEGDVIPASTGFIATDGAENYTFQTTDNFFWQQNDIGRWFADVDVVQGIYVTEEFTQDEIYLNRFILHNKKVDTSMMTVDVYTSSGSTQSDRYTYAYDINDLGQTSKVYFLQEAYNGNVEIFFGDGLISAKPTPNSLIKIKYFVTDGAAANNIVAYKLMNRVKDINPSYINVSATEISNSGGDREETESIRINAPRFFQRQNRNVTVNDFENAILSEFGGWIDSVRAWGGEDNEPPRYGAVYISVKPSQSDFLSKVQKREIIARLEKKNIPCVSVIIEDPKIINLDMALSVEYDKYKTNKSKTEIENIVTNTVNSYFETEVLGFSSNFNYSKFIAYVSNAEQSIQSVVPELTMKQSFLPFTNNASNYSVNFINPVLENSVMIGPWVDAGSTIAKKIIDKDGKLYIVENAVQTEVGSIDYTTGKLDIVNIEFRTPPGEKLNVTAKPKNNNVNSDFNYLLYHDVLYVNLTESRG